MPWPRSVVGEVAEVLGGAEVGPDRAVVLHGVAAVVVALPGLQQRHQVQVGDAELLEVVEVLGDALEVAREPVGVAGVAEHPRLLQPVGGEQPPLVEQVQVGRALGVRRRRGAHQPGEQRTRDLGVGVDLGDRRLEVGPVAVQPQREGLPPLGAQPARADESVQAERALRAARPPRRGSREVRSSLASFHRPTLSACACPSPTCWSRVW